GSEDTPLFSVILPDDPKAKSVQVLFEDENRQVWAGTHAGLYKVNIQGALESVDAVKPLTGDAKIYTETIIKDRHGAMWIGTANAGIFRVLPNGEVDQFAMENGLPGFNVPTLFEDKSGRIWAGMRPGIGDGLFRLVADPQKNQNIVERAFTTKDGLPSSWITDLYGDGDKFWI